MPFTAPEIGIVLIILAVRPIAMKIPATCSKELRRLPRPPVPRVDAKDEKNFPIRFTTDPTSSGIRSARASMVSTKKSTRTSTICGI